MMHIWYRRVFMGLKKGIKAFFKVGAKTYKNNDNKALTSGEVFDNILERLFLSRAQTEP